MYRLALFLAIALVSRAAFAIPGNYLDYGSLSAQERETLGVYVTGAGEAYGWANATLKSKGGAPLFCIPDKLSLNGYNYEKIFKDEVERHRSVYTPMLDTPGVNSLSLVGLVLLNGLEATFPCGK